MAHQDEYVPGRWDEVQRVVSRAIFGNGRPELRVMADGMAVKVVQGLINAGYWVCRRKRPNPKPTLNS